MSSSNNLFRTFNESDRNATAVPIVPFPNLTPDSNPNSDRRDKVAHHQLANHMNGSTSGSTRAPSAPISFPKSHIHRTPSELQIEQSLIQAEQSDHIMYARLVRGMTERGAALHNAQADASNRGYELSRKSLMGVVECRQKPIVEEGHWNHDDDEECHVMPSGARARELANGNVDPTADSGWSIGYSYKDNRGSEKHGGLSGTDLQVQLLTHPNANKSVPQEHEHCREVSASSHSRADDEEDDCVFSLEM